MFPVGVLIAWAGYGLGSWGWILVKGYNITFTEWFNPVHVFEWPGPQAKIPMVPAGSVWPTAKGPAAGQ